MAPINFDNDIKNKLEERTIEPSANAWDKLSDRLDASEQKNSKKGFFWLAIAASIVGILLVSQLFFKNTLPNNSTPIIVDTTQESDTEKTIEQTNKEKVSTNLEDVLVEKENGLIPEERKTSSSTFNNKTQVVELNIDKSNIKERLKKGEKINNLNTSEITGINNKEQQSEILLAQNETENNLIAKVIEVTDTEIDALLNRAKQDIVKQENQSDNTIALDYNELLQDVEDDLEESFRDKMLKKVKESYYTVKTVVAERND